MTSPAGLNCPSCGKEQHTVLETRQRDGTIRRKRKCFKCSARFWTVETTVETIAKMRKTR